MQLPDLHLLPKIRDSWSYLYVEHCRIDQEDKAIAIHDATGRTPVPCEVLTLLMLGPGTTITHAAVRTPLGGYSHPRLDLGRIFRAAHGTGIRQGDWQVGKLPTPTPRLTPALPRILHPTPSVPKSDSFRSATPATSRPAQLRQVPNAS